MELGKKMSKNKIYGEAKIARQENSEFSLSYFCCLEGGPRPFFFLLKYFEKFGLSKNEKNILPKLGSEPRIEKKSGFYNFPVTFDPFPTKINKKKSPIDSGPFSNNRYFNYFYHIS